MSLKVFQGFHTGFRGLLGFQGISSIFRGLQDIQKALRVVFRVVSKGVSGDISEFLGVSFQEPGRGFRNFSKAF